MLTFLGGKRRFCDGVSRRNFLRVGALSLGGLTLADLLRLDARGAIDGNARGKSVIMIYLPGGPSHMDMYDMKPLAASEFRGEFRSIGTNVPGIEICEHMPLQTQIMDKMTIVRGMRMAEQHSPRLLLTGDASKTHRPPLGSIVSYLQHRDRGLPAYVSLNYRPEEEDPIYTGAANRPFATSGPGLNDLSLVSNVSLDRLHERAALMHDLDTLKRDIDYRGALAGVDAFTTRAIDMVSNGAASDAFRIELEPQSVRDLYGDENKELLKARRLVEAGVSVVTLSLGGWDTHAKNFIQLRKQLPRVDRGIHALVTDLHQRGLDKDVAVVVWGEFGRTPRINMNAGRDHWPAAGFALLAGGDFKHGQVIGETDARGERAKNRPSIPSNVLATLYHHLGIDPAVTITDHNGRPTALLDDREPLTELL